MDYLPVAVFHVNASALIGNDPSHSSLTISDRLDDEKWNYVITHSRFADMPIPRHILEQLKALIPPLNGTLHKGQSGQSYLH